jgi:peptidoglycan/xylan/chitin deacetylase (PgdA/CDA1 family)
VKRIATVAISLGFFTFDQFLRALYLLTGKKAPARPVVLAYHSVSKQKRAVFARQMDKVARCSKSSDSNGHATNGRRAFVTFDDGFQNIFDNALPELEQRRIPAAIFVVAGALGTTPNWKDYSGSSDPEMHEPILTAEQLRKLPCDLIQIGSHTVTHPMLPLLSEKQARIELAESRTMLEGIIGRKVKLFSFPYGSASASLVKWCQEEGYEQLFITYPRTAFLGSDRVIARVKVDLDEWPLEFHLKLRGAYRWRNRWRDWWKRRG